jgi:hypothetical protein
VSEGLYEKNIFEFVEKMNDILVLFDVEALFPIIPVDDALELSKRS